MNYKYCNEDNYEDFACGRVIYHKAGMTNFPVRLTQEMYRRALSYSKKDKDIVVYDPCCGTAYILTILGLLNKDTISRLIGSDINEEVLVTAKKNLALLTNEGLEVRKKEIQKMYNEFGKLSHYEALESIDNIRNLIRENESEELYQVFLCDILSKGALVDKAFKADIVITDVPYGDKVEWSEKNNTNINAMLDTLLPILTSDSIVVIASSKNQKIQHEKYKRLEKNYIGKRKFEILQPILG